MSKHTEGEWPATCSDCGKGCWYTEPCEHCEAAKKQERAEMLALLARARNDLEEAAKYTNFHSTNVHAINALLGRVKGVE